MASVGHRLAVYFGLAEPTAADLAAAPPPASRRRWLVRVLAIAVVGALGSALIDGDAWTGIRFGVVMFIVFAASEVARRRAARLDDDRR